MNKKNLYLIIIVSFLLTISCKKEDSPKNDNPTEIDTSNCVFIINEGNFQGGNSKISYYNPKTKTFAEDIFFEVNNRPLGDVCQSMTFFNNKIYIVVNNSNKIEVVEKNTFSSIATINGFTSPRYILPVSATKAYITDLYSNKISIINLDNNQISGYISCEGWTEELCLINNKVFVTNYNKNKLYVINPISDIITDSISINYGANSMSIDKNDNIWVLCSGSQSLNLKPSLHKINSQNNIVEQSIYFISQTENPSRLTINYNKDTLYYLNKGVFKMPISNTFLPENPFISEGNKIFYGLGVDKKNYQIYVSDAIDYVQKGVVYIYNSNGNEITNFRASIIPSSFYFK